MPDTAYPDLLLRRDDEIAMITLNVPDRLNPLTHALQTSLCQALADLTADNSVRALVLTGAGRGFCAGADLSGGPSDDGSGRSRGQQSADTMHRLTNRMVRDLRALPLPVVCAVNGVAAGGGLGLALAGDVVLAARSAYFYLPFMAKLGIVPDVGSTWFYQRLLGTDRATALTLPGVRLPTDKAAVWGMVWDKGDQSELPDKPEFTEGVRALLEKHALKFAPR
jgi:2-(1,2-epoxy-1,2-dihydrophenyl)acetyl-CoA isomerase